jgi:ubiE/COQ5 methyltransferase family
MQRVLSLGGKVMVLEFSGDAASYLCLAESIRRHPNREALAETILEAGLEQVSVHNLLAGHGGDSHWICAVEARTLALQR